MRSLGLLPALAGLVLAGAGCGVMPTAGSGGRLLVVAAENVWGSIAAQLAGDRADVVSIVSNPATDPHDYEATPRDGRAVAEASYVIVNGAGYDAWAGRLVAANPSSDRTVLTVADLAGRHEGDNPHMWYAPAIVARVVDRITADLQHLDPGDSAYFGEQRAHFLGTSLRRYDDLRAQIHQNYAGMRVGATESIVEDLASDLGLDLVTPPGYLRAVSEGTDPSAKDKTTVDAQITGKQVAVLVFNSQNATTDIQALLDRARAEGIPVVALTETLSPAGATFESWQSDQLQRLAAALGQAVGR